jgi:hypothetical protein
MAGAFSVRGFDEQMFGANKQIPRGRPSDEEAQKGHSLLAVSARGLRYQVGPITFGIF